LYIETGGTLDIKGLKERDFFLCIRYKEITPLVQKLEAMEADLASFTFLSFFSVPPPQKKEMRSAS
jgi:hypothetical protein